MSPAPTITDADGERRILDAADALFAARGVTDVTMADVRDAAEVSMRRLYRFVDGKPELVASWLADRDRRWLDRFDTAVDRRLADGATPVDAVFDVLAEVLVDGDYRGCAFLRTLTELSPLPEPIRAVIVAHKRAFAQSLALRLVTADAGRGDGVDGDGLLLLVDGAITHAALQRDLTPIRRAQRLAHLLLTPLPITKDHA